MSRRASTGMTIGKPPKTGKDTRQFFVTNENGTDIRKCWYKETATELAKMLGTGYSVGSVKGGTSIARRQAKKITPEPVKALPRRKKRRVA